MFYKFFFSSFSGVYYFANIIFCSSSCYFLNLNLNLNWLLRFMVLNSLCLIPLNLYLSGSTILILGIWIPLRVQYLLGLISDHDFFRYVYGIFDMSIKSIIRGLLFLLNFMYQTYLRLVGVEYKDDILILETLSHLHWYINLMILTIQFLLIITFIYFIYSFVSFKHNMLWELLFFFFIIFLIISYSFLFLFFLFSYFRFI